MNMAVSNGIFTQWWNAGYRQLLPIMPADAKVKEGLNGVPGKTPGIKLRSGEWVPLKGWYNLQPTHDQVLEWERMGAGAGLRLGEAFLLDIDAYDPAVADMIEQEALAELGPAPCRIGQQPKRALLYQAEGQVSIQRLQFAGSDGKTNQIELTAQMVVEGIHATTKQPYSWPRGRKALKELTPVSAEKLASFLTRMQALLPEAKRGAETSADRAGIDQPKLKGDPDRIKRAMAALPNDRSIFGYKEWVDIAAALHGACQDDPDFGMDLFCEFSEKADLPAPTEDPVRVYKSVQPPFGLGADYIYSLATKYGDPAFWLDELGDEPLNVFEEVAQREAATNKATDTYKLVTVDDIMNRPPLEWLVDRHFPRTSVGLLYSVPGAGKSFWILDIALHIAAGLKEWNGDPLTYEDDAQVLYLAAEGSYGFKPRLQAWIKQHGHSENLAKRFKMIEETINFLKPDDAAKLLRTVQAAQIATGKRFALVIVDTVSRAMAGADENLQQDMSRFVEACDIVRNATGGAVVGVHHAGKAGDMRGSTVLTGGADFIFRLDRKKGMTVGHITCEKQKYASDGWEEPYRFDVVALDDGDSSLCVERADMTLGPGTELTPDAAARVFAAMREAWDAGQPWAKVPQTKERYAVRRMVTDFGFEAEAAEAALQLWEGSGMIRVEQASRHSRVKGYKVLADPGQTVQSDDIFD